MTHNHVVTFYSIERIKDHKKVGRTVERFCTKHNIVGTFFSTPQGVNTTLSGNNKFLKGLISLLEKKFLLDLKEQTWSISKALPFKRLKIKCRDRLLPLKGDFDPVESRGKHLNFSEWNALILDSNTVVIAGRNDYETEIGSFRNSLIPNMSNLTEFPDFIEKNLLDNKDKKIAMFCTGGIRCEVASSFMIDKGFNDVYQLDGGILRYLKDAKDENLWQGECFVFDERVTVDKYLKPGKYHQCFGCRRPLSNQDLKSQYYEKGISCHHCFKFSSEKDKERFAQRQLQIELAEKRGHLHMGAKAKQN